MGKPQANVPPWHLWGNSAIISVPPSSLFVDDVNRTFVASTIVRVQYGRPETWHFQYGVSIVSGPTMPPTITAQPQVFFQLITGVGRGVMRRTLNGPIFDPLGYGGGPTPAPCPIGNGFWINAIPSGMEFDEQERDGAGLPVGNRTAVTVPTDHFVADFISVEATANFVVSLPAPINLEPIVIELNCQVAPKTHIRPDWYADPPGFDGGEEGGR